MHKDTIAFIGLDTSKMKISVALAEDGRQGEVRFFGDIDSTPDAVRRLVSKLSGRYSKLAFCYEAGPTGYGLHRQIVVVETGEDNDWNSFRDLVCALKGVDSKTVGQRKVQQHNIVGVVLEHLETLLQTVCMVDQGPNALRTAGSTPRCEAPRRVCGRCRARRLHTP